MLIRIQKLYKYRYKYQLQNPGLYATGSILVGLWQALLVDLNENEAADKNVTVSLEHDWMQQEEHVAK